MNTLKHFATILIRMFTYTDWHTHKSCYTRTKGQVQWHCQETEGFKGTEHEGLDMCEDGCVWGRTTVHVRKWVYTAVALTIIAIMLTGHEWRGRERGREQAKKHKVYNAHLWVKKSEKTHRGKLNFASWPYEGPGQEGGGTN